MAFRLGWSFAKDTTLRHASLQLGGIKSQSGRFSGASAGSYIIAAKITISSTMVLVLRE